MYVILGTGNKVSSLRMGTLLFVIMAWIFVLSRLVHAYIHVSSNTLSQRGFWFGVGVFTLALMWLIFIVRILLGLP